MSSSSSLSSLFATSVTRPIVNSCDRTTIQASLPSSMTLVSFSLLPTMVYYASSDSSSFQSVGTGMLGVIIDRHYHTTYVRVYDKGPIVPTTTTTESKLSSSVLSLDPSILLQVELYAELANKLTFLTPTFVTMETDNGTLGFGFRQQHESEQFVNDLLHYLPSHVFLDEYDPSKTGNDTVNTGTGRNKGSSTVSSSPSTNTHPSVKPTWFNQRFRRLSRRTVDKSSSSTSASAPMDYVIGDIIPGSFKHTGHIGFNRNSTPSAPFTRTVGTPSVSVPSARDTLTQTIENLPPDIKQGLKALGVKKKDILKDPLLYASIVALSSQPTGVPSSSSSSSLAVTSATMEKTKVGTNSSDGQTSMRNIEISAPSKAAVPNVPSSITGSTVERTMNASEGSVVTMIPPPLPVRRRASLGTVPAVVTNSTGNSPMDQRTSANAAVVGSHNYASKGLRMSTAGIALPKYPSTTATNTISKTVTQSSSSGMVTVEDTNNTLRSNMSTGTPLMEVRPSYSSQPICQSTNSTSNPLEPVVTDNVPPMKDTKSTKNTSKSPILSSQPSSLLQDIQSFSKHKLRDTSLSAGVSSAPSSLPASSTDNHANVMMNKLKEMVANRRSMIHHGSNDTDNDDDGSDSDW